MGFYDVNPPEWPEPRDCFIDDATEEWYDMMLESNENDMARYSDYIKDFTKLKFLSSKIQEIYEDYSGFYCEIDNSTNADNRSLAIKMSICLNLAETVISRVRSNIDSDLDLSCITEDDVDDAWIYDRACELDDEACEPDPDAEYDAWREQRDGYY